MRKGQKGGSETMTLTFEKRLATVEKLIHALNTHKGGIGMCSTKEEAWLWQDYGTCLYAIRFFYIDYIKKAKEKANGDD